MSPTYDVPSDQERRTPPWLYRACCDRLGVDDCALDAFASTDNALCLYWYGGPTVAAESPWAALDGMSAPWADPTFANPPFSLMPRVVDKALRESLRGVRCAIIGPSGCSQVWFHKLWPRAQVWIPDRRLTYLTRDGFPTDRAMQDTAVYVVDGRDRAEPEVHVLRVDALRGDEP